MDHPRLPVINFLDENIKYVGGSLPFLPQKSSYNSNLSRRAASKPLLTDPDAPTKSQLTSFQAQDASCGSFLSLHQIDTRDTKNTDQTCTLDRILKTFVLYLSFFALGLVNGVVGPTLIELQSISHTTTAKAALLFTWGAIGRVPGSLTTAFTFGKFCPNLQLASAVVLTAASTCLLPWCHHYIFMAIVMGFQGFGIGSMGGGCTAYCFKLWTRTAAPYIQALAFTIALGSTCAPLLARPFLATLYYHNASYSISSINHTANVSNKDESIPATTISHLYLIISSILLISAILYALLYMKDRLKLDQHDTPKGISEGLEVSFGGLVFTFAVDHLTWNTNEAVYLTFAYWACVAAGRGLGIILVRHISPRKIVLLDLSGAFAALVVMAACSGRHVAVEWLCSCLLGLSLSTLVATTLNLAYAYIQLSGKLASIFMCCNYVGIMVLPGLTGALFRMVHGMCFVFVCLATVVAMVIVFAAIQLIHGGQQRSFSVQGGSIDDQDVAINS
ncbi:hypothetical protein CAPTEDRAFT_216230 [Capitella teleta]|uniref:Uncharacterized protein n=1 Tax=Capitella teleta TaxID=283909 RepID=R7VDL9_CAPTE|nr:hypothetical protein CAPTEDRAFT_216230 [Capitella teleta]|eukprot:ELU16943.1 hypothetical protein CAPTEDRAFT_216230 [Capitella teleta]